MAVSVLTDLREYHRGRRPGDWTPRWALTPSWLVEGFWCDPATRNRLIVAATGAAADAALIWEAVVADADRPRQEWEFRVRLLAGSGARRILGLRLNPDVSLNGFFLSLDPAADTVLIHRGTGVITTVASGTTPFNANEWIRGRFRADGTTISAKIWRDFDEEPASWTASGTGTGLADGAMGLLVSVASQRQEFSFLSARTGGGTALGEASLPRPMAVWSKDPSVKIELSAEIEMRNPQADALETFFISDRGRQCGPTDWPPNLSMRKLLLDAGRIAEELGQDLQFSGVTQRKPSQLRIRTDRGQADFLLRRSLAGHLVTVRAAEASSLSHRAFEPILSAMIGDAEPGSGSEVASLPLEPLHPKLKQDLDVHRYVGIPTGVGALTTGGSLSIPSHAAYSLSSFAIYLRAFIPTGGVAGAGSSGLSLRWDGAALPTLQWRILLGHAGSATPHRLTFQSCDPAGAYVINATTAENFNLGRYLDIILAVQGGVRWYAFADRERVLSGTLSAHPSTGAGPVLALTSAPGVIVLDHRIEPFVEEEEALARFAARLAPDALSLGMHRCDDGVGGILTDYSATANHGAMVGTENTDWRWESTDLGSPELAGQPMPLAAGALFNAKAQKQDLGRDRYRLSDRALGAEAPLAEVRAKGLAIVGGGTDYTDVGNGAVDMVTAQSEPVHFETAPAASPESKLVHAPLVARELLTSRGRFSSPSESDSEAWEGLRRLLPYRAGFFSATPVSGQKVLEELLAPTLAHIRQDRDGRLLPGYLLPPITPGPYGMEPCLEFLGLDGSGVDFGQAIGSNPAASHSVGCIFKTFQDGADASLGTPGSFAPAGQTLYDRVALSPESGAYLGLSGVVPGQIVWGHPGVLGTSTGLPYLVSPPGTFRRGRYYLVLGQFETGSNRRSLLVADLAERTVREVAAEPCSSAYVPANSEGNSLRLGGSDRGPLIGTMMCVQVWSRVISTVEAASQLLAKAWTSRSSPANLHFWAPLNEGAGSVVYDLDLFGHRGSLLGVRWAPQRVFDFGAAPSSFSVERIYRLKPAWLSEVGYLENHAPLGDGDFAAPVPPEDRHALKRDRLSIPWKDRTILADFPNARSFPNHRTLLQRQEDGARVSAEIAARFADRAAAELADIGHQALPLQVTDEVWLRGARYYLDAPAAFRVTAAATELGPMKTRLGLWGGASEGGYLLAGPDEFLLAGNAGGILRS